MIYSVLLIFYLILVARAVAQAFYSIKHPSRSLSWILVILFVPIIGLMSYYLVGRSVKRDKFFEIKKPFFNLQEDLSLDHPKIQQKKDLARLLSSNNSSALSYHNKVSAHLNGQEIFELIKEDIVNARHTIHLDFYIVECGVLLNSLQQIFAKKIMEGIQIRLVYDGFGTKDEYSDTFQAMRDAGVEIREFMPYSWIKKFDYINYRNHRKMIVIDSHITYTGGMNISHKHIDGDPVLGIWRDTFVRIIGQASYHADLIFASDWFHAGGGQLDISPRALVSNYDTPVQIISSGRDSEYMGILHQYYMMIAEAEDYIYIATPYFVPGESIITALKTKALSGVKVELMMPNNSDSKWMKWIMYTHLEDLLKAGVKVWIYHEGFLHNKVLLSDDSVCSIGSANVDERSFATNFEINAVVYSDAVVQEVKDQFEEDKRSCELLQFETFIDRKDRNKFLEALARLTSPLM